MLLGEKKGEQNVIHTYDIQLVAVREEVYFTLFY